MNNNVERFSGTSDLLGSDLLNAARIEVPSSEDLQKRILAATKTMRQEDSMNVLKQPDKPTLWAQLRWPALPITVAASLSLGLAVWVPVSQNLNSDITASTVASVSAVSTPAVTNSEDVSLSIEELELYELLLLQDELILAQF